MHRQLLSALLAGGLFLVALPAAAADEITSETVSTSTTVNAGAVSIPGSIALYQSAFGTINFKAYSAWSAKVYAGISECLRLDVTAANQNLEMIVVSPVGGYVYRNADRSGTNNRPLVKIAPSPIYGWYTVIVAGESGGNATFTLRYGRFNNGNTNCSNPTPQEAGPAPELSQLLISP